MLCKKCGAEIPDDAQMCEYCGAQILTAADTVSNDSEDNIYNENEKKRKKQIDKMLEDKEAQLSEIQKRRDSKKAKQKRWKLAIIAASCLLAAAALGGGGYYVYNAVTISNMQMATPTPRPTALTTAIPVTPAPLASALPTVSPVSSAAPNNWSSTGSAASNSGGTSNSSGTSAAGGGSASGGGSSTSGKTSNTNTSTGSKSASNSGSSSASSNKGTSNVTAGRDSGVTTNVINSQLAVGHEVIHEDDKWYMTFTSGGVKYYAHVNVGATTAQVQNKNYTLNATPTSETYKGNTVYEITSMTKYEGRGYILEASGVRLLTKSDLSGLSKEDLALARNEIYARHGRRFTTPAYQRYFESKSWYAENPSYNYDDDNANLNDIEIKNVQLIIDNEK